MNTSTASQAHRNALPAGYQLAEYRILSILGHGGFGITYRARDENLQQDVAIKEYLPRDVATRGYGSTVAAISDDERKNFEWGLDRFLDEAKTLTRFNHPNIIGIRRFLRTNGTAYLVMDYCAGESLDKTLDRERTLSPDAIERMLDPLLDALEELHNAGVMHRDIKPGNIYLKDDGSPLLLDFGAARQALAQHSRSLTTIVTPGYAAIEQYSARGKQGPWTDIYGLGATLYRCVTGQRPVDASDRMLDEELIPAARAAADYPHDLLELIDTALILKPEDRPQSIPLWLVKRTSVSPPPVPSEPSPPAAGSQTRDASVRSVSNSSGVRPRDQRNGGGLWIMGGILVFLTVVVVSQIKERSPPAPSQPTAQNSRPEAVRSGSATAAQSPAQAAQTPTAMPQGDQTQRPQSPPAIASAPPQNPETHRTQSPPVVASTPPRVEPPADQRPATGSVRRDRMPDSLLGPEMVFIRGGVFTIGSPANENGRREDEQQTLVTVGDFWIAKHAVTFDEYDRFALATGRTRPNDHGWGRGRRPVIDVSWDDATAYTAWLSQQTAQPYRLPNEAEWEYAARAGTSTARYWGEDMGRNLANCRDCGSQWGGKQTAPVGSFTPNAWGLYDMLGNVWEWTCSAHEPRYGGAERRCETRATRYVLRGGSWLDTADLVRAAHRTPSTRESKFDDYGFRVAKSATIDGTSTDQAVAGSGGAGPVHLTVRPTPASARVRILNIQPVYHNGIQLDPGHYHIEVSAQGYQTRQDWYDLRSGQQTLQIELERIAGASEAQRQPQAVPPTGRAETSLIAERYQAMGSRGEIIFDTRSALEWQRCSLGQQWTGQACVGEATVSNWQDARRAADEISGWRLPTKEELMTLVYCPSGRPAHFKNTHQRCDGEYQPPTIFAAAFPNTRSTRYWSSSRPNGLQAGSVDFFDGRALDILQFGEFPVRLVRNRR